MSWAEEAGIPVFPLGGGSNLLVADAGFDGLVIQLSEGTVEIEPRGDRARVRADAGFEWDALVAHSVAAGLAGLECLSGIPGKVGAAPMQNVGAYGQEVAETLVAVHVLELATGEVRRWSGEQCGFDYRTSHFKGAWRGRYVVTRVDFELSYRTAGTARYPELKRRLASSPATLAEVRSAVLEIRRSKSMVIEPDDPDRRSAGSFFTNPIVEPGVAERVGRLASGEVPAFPAQGGRIKLSAARLIEEAGFQRGYGSGRAGLSSRHVLAVVNRGGASAAELIGLATEVRAGVRDAFGVTLQPEPVLLGFGHDADELLG